MVASPAEGESAPGALRSSARGARPLGTSLSRGVVVATRSGFAERMSAAGPRSCSSAQQSEQLGILVALCRADAGTAIGRTSPTVTSKQHDQPLDRGRAVGPRARLRLQFGAAISQARTVALAEPYREVAVLE